MKLPAPALACACPACKRRLNLEYAEIIRAGFDTDEILDLMEIARIEEGRKTVGERVAVYTMKES